MEQIAEHAIVGQQNEDDAVGCRGVSPRSPRRLLLVLLPLVLAGCTHVKLVDQGRYYPQTDWITDLRYDANSIYPLTMSAAGCPQIDVRLNGKSVPLIFDFGCSKGFQVTTAVKDRLNYQILEETNTYHADGTVRGKVRRIRVNTLEVCGRQHRAQEGTLADWRIASSVPYRGLLGLEYLANQRFTLDYRQRKLGASNKPFPAALRESGDYAVIEMPRPPQWHKYGVYVLGKVNGIDCVIHIDTGSSHTTIDPAVLTTPKRPGEVTVSLGGVEFAIKDFRVAPVKHPSEYRYPVRMGIGSDLLRHFVITVDRTENKNLLIIHK